MPNTGDGEQQSVCSFVVFVRYYHRINFGPRLDSPSSFINPRRLDLDSSFGNELFQKTFCEPSWRDKYQAVAWRCQLEHIDPFGRIGKKIRRLRVQKAQADDPSSRKIDIVLDIGLAQHFKIGRTLHPIQRIPGRVQLPKVGAGEIPQGQDAGLGPTRGASETIKMCADHFGVNAPTP